MNNSLALSSIAFSNKHTVINHLVTLHDVASSEKNSIVDGPFGSSLKTSDYVADGIPVLQGKNITGNKFKFTDIRFISLQKSKELIRSKVVVGDILVIKIGSIGYAAEIDDLGGYPYAIIPANLAKISIDKNKIVKNYLLQWLKTDSVKKYFESVASKTAQPALSLGKIKDLPVPLPPLAEQQRIAALLDTADNILKQRESAITKLDQLAQSVFVAMFSNIEHITTLSQVAELKRGPFGGALKKEIFVKHGPMVYEQRNAIYDDCKNGKYFITEEKFNEMKDFSVTDNDLIVSCSGTLGKVAKIDKESPRGIINQALLRVRPKKNISSSFLKSAIESVSVQRNLAISSHGSGLQNFPPMAVVKAVPIPLPSFELQMKFESIKEEILKKKIDLINSKNNLENLLKSLQHQSFAVN